MSQRDIHVDLVGQNVSQLESEHVWLTCIYKVGSDIWSPHRMHDGPDFLIVAVGVLDRCARADDRLVYSRYDDDTNIYAIDLERPEERGLPEPMLVASSTRQELQPQVSPDGERLAFVSNRSGFFEIYSSKLDGSDLKQNTAFKGLIVGMPSWSPDSRSLVFHAHNETGADLYSVDADGSRSLRLTDDRANELNASWSASGEWIYFATDRSGDWQVWRMGIGGESIQQITHDGGFRGMENSSGESLVFFKHDEQGIWERPLKGGPERLLIGEMVLSEFGHWTVARTGIWYVRRGTDGGLAFYDFATEVTRPTTSPTSRFPIHRTRSRSLLMAGPFFLYRSSEAKATSCFWSAQGGPVDALAQPSNLCWW